LLIIRTTPPSARASQHTALDARQQGRGGAARVHLGRDVAGGLHVPDAVGDRALPAPHQSGDHGAGHRTEQRIERAALPLVPVALHDPVPPRLPGGPGRQLTEQRLLVDEDPENGHRKSGTDSPRARATVRG
jgi:hypothetical protein